VKTLDEKCVPSCALCIDLILIKKILDENKMIISSAVSDGEKMASATII
jgi:hypothetical protein